MLSVILALAVNCVQAPPVKPHHKRPPTPVASCVAPPPAFLVAEIELIEFSIYRYYDTPGMCYQDTPPAVDSLQPVSPVGFDSPQPVSGGPYYPPVIGGGGTVVDLTPPPHWAPPGGPRLPPPVHATTAPEISSQGLVSSLTLLLGALAVTRGRRS